MNPTEELRAKLDELGIEHYDHENGEQLREEAEPVPATSWRVGNASFLAVPDKHGTFDVWIDHCAPEQAVTATVGRCDTIGLWTEWEQVLFANVSDEVAQDNLNECVHELLDKAATMGVGMCHSTSNWTNVFKCSVCGFEYDFVTDPYQGPKFCPGCGRKVVVK